MASEEPRSCPTAEQLEGLLAGTLEPEPAAALEAHVEGCAACRRYLQEARANNELLDGVVQALRREEWESGRLAGADTDADAAAAGEPCGPKSFLGRQWIAGYEILEEIGRGGMGVVYKARQTSTKRIVALKVLLEGPFASDAAKRRFEREIELAASLNHPNIVAIHDSGVSHGCYYCAMDFVEGVRLDRYVSQRRPAVREVVRLFQRIAHTVNYAHQRGVIHRDLKPSNILVDAEGQPHILDFGLAKTLVTAPGESLLISVSGEVMGTLPYMSPEQATGGEIDSRTDVYALGVILYELLTGQYPYPVVGQMAEVLRNIAQAEPARPSTIVRRLDNDLETIVLKGLAKEKDHRYDSAAGLAADLARYLAGEAIEAKRDSGWYVLRKTLRRYRVPVTAAAGLMVAAVIVAIAMGSLYRQSEQHRLAAQAGAQRLAEEFQAGLVEQGRALAMAGNVAQAEDLLWRQALARPDDELAIWALRELYDWHPNVAKVQASAAALTSVAFPADGATVVTADARGQVAVWDAATLRPVTRMVAAGVPVAADISPDGRIVAAVAGDGQVWLWDAASGKQLHAVDEARMVLAGDAEGERAEERIAPRIRFSPDGRTLVVSDGTTAVRLIDAGSGQERAQLAGHLAPVSAIAVSPNGQLVASASHDKTVRVWETATGRGRAILAGHLDAVTSVAFSPDGRMIGSGGRDGSVILWQADTGQCLAGLEGHGCWVDAVAFSRDGRTIASGDIRGQIRLWSLATGRCLATIAAHTEDVEASQPAAVRMAASPQGLVLATGARGGVLKLWDISLRHSVRSWGGHDGWVVAAANSADGRTAATLDGQGTVRVWDVVSGQCRTTFSQGERWPRLDEPHAVAGWNDPVLAGRQQAIAISPDGRLVAAPAPDVGGVAVYDVPAGERTALLEGWSGRVQSLCFSPDGRMVAGADGGGQVRLWNASNGRAIAAIEGAGRFPVPSMRWLDGLLAYAAGPDICLYDVQANRGAGELRGHAGEVWSIAVSPDGQWLASAATDGVRLWDVTRRQCVATLPSRAGATYSVAFSPDGRMLACATAERTIELWQVPSGKRLGTLAGDGRLAWSLAFESDGRRVMAAGSRPNMRSWDLASFDGALAGNSGFHVERIRSAAPADEIDWAVADQWVASLAGERTEGAAAVPAALAVAEGRRPVGPEVVAYWGLLTRQGLLATNQHLSRQTQMKIPVAGPDEPAAPMHLMARASEASQAVEADDWPLRRNPAPADEPADVQLASALGDVPGTLQWRAVAGDAVLSDPAIGPDGTLYVGCQDGGVYAYGTDGALRWRFKTGGQIPSSPAIGPDGTIYAGSCDYKLYALRPDGTEKWSIGTRGRISSSPAVGADGTVYIGSNDYRLYAVDPAGRRLWECVLGGPIHYSSPAIGADGTIYIGCFDGHLYAVRPNGQIRWKLDVGDYVCASPAIGPDGTIYIGSQDSAFAIDGSFHPGTGDQRLCAVNPDGTKRWEVLGLGPLFSSPVIGADGTIYVGSRDGQVHAIGADGRKRWAFRTGKEVNGSPAVAADGTIYVGSYDGMLYAISPEGLGRWAFATRGFIGSSPAIGHDGTVYFGSHDHGVYAVRGAAGLARSAWPHFRGAAGHSGRVVTADGSRVRPGAARVQKASGGSADDSGEY